MKISYTSGSSYSGVPSPRRGGGPHLDVITGVVIAVILVVGGALWYFFSRPSPVETIPAPVQASLPKELIERPFNPADGLKQCEKLTPNIVTKEDQGKRSKCYGAVMIVFGTTDICTATTLDGPSASLCVSAQATYEHIVVSTSSNGLPITANPNGPSAIDTFLSVKNGTLSGTGLTQGSQGTNTKPGTQNPGTNPTQPGQPGATTTPSQTLTSTTTPTSTPGTTGGPGATPPVPTSTTTASNEPPPETCTPQPGIILLQHTNDSDSKC